MTVEILLAKLKGVRKTGVNRWMARCSAHPDRRPSLSIREKDDGLVLLRCHAGCEPCDVLQAVGLDFSAVFPPRAIDHRVGRERDPFYPRDILYALADEAHVAAIVAARIAYGYSVDAQEVDRLMLAVSHIANAADVFRPHPADGRRGSLTRAENDAMLVEVTHAA